MASLEEDKLAVFQYLGVSDIWLDKSGGFFEEDKLAVFHYLGVSDIWLDKTGGFS
jgi:hypothetical protein